MAEELHHSCHVKVNLEMHPEVITQLKLVVSVVACKSCALIVYIVIYFF